MPARLCVFLGSIAVAAFWLAGELRAEPADAPFKLADRQLEPVKWADVAGRATSSAGATKRTRSRLITIAGRSRPAPSMDKSSKSAGSATHSRPWRFRSRARLG